MNSIARHYTAYGLCIQSEIAVPLSPSCPVVDPDVTIRIGAAPEAPAVPGSADRPWGLVAPGVFLLHVEGVARYSVTEGRDILVEPTGGGDEAVSAFLLGSVLAACLKQRGILTLHASAIETGAGAVLFAGRSGSGKSTLLAAFIDRGYAMLADDVTGVLLDTRDRPMALPAFPCVRLWANAMDKLDWWRRARGKVREELEKYLVPVGRIPDTPIPLRAVFVLASRGREEIEIEAPLLAAAAFECQLRHIYRRKHTHELGGQSGQFRTLGAIARQVPVVRVRRPAGRFVLDELADGIDRALREERPAEAKRRRIAPAGCAPRACAAGP